MGRLEKIKQNNERRKELFKDGIPNDIKFADVDWLIEVAETSKKLASEYDKRVPCLALKLQLAKKLIELFSLN